MVKAVVLLSGGLDSSTTLAMAKEMGYTIHALTLLYGQRHSREIDAARSVAGSMEVSQHRIIELPGGMFSGSSLTGQGEIPASEVIDRDNSIPTTYVPARNLVFLSIAVSYAEAIDADAVFIGVTAIDYSGYPDCRPEFISSFEETSKLATKKGVEGRPIKIITPLLYMNKAQIISKGAEIGVDHSLTWSCYNGREKACGKCDSCLYRLKGFKEAGIPDPILYEGD